eukprot:672993_1
MAEAVNEYVSLSHEQALHLEAVGLGTDMSSNVLVEYRKNTDFVDKLVKQCYISDQSKDYDSLYQSSCQLIEFIVSHFQNEGNMSLHFNYAWLFEHAVQSKLITLHSNKQPIIDSYHSICKDSITLLQKYLTDLYSYLVRIRTRSANLESAQVQAFTNEMISHYETADNMRKELFAAHPTGLEVVINYAFNVYVLLDDIERAKKMLQTVFDEAIDNLETVGDTTYMDCVPRLQVMMETRKSIELIQNSRLFERTVTVLLHFKRMLNVTISDDILQFIAQMISGISRKECTDIGHITSRNMLNSYKYKQPHGLPRKRTIDWRQNCVFGIETGPIDSAQIELDDMTKFLFSTESFVKP